MKTFWYMLNAEQMTFSVNGTRIAPQILIQTDVNIDIILVPFSEKVTCNNWVHTIKTHCAINEVIIYDKDMSVHKFNSGYGIS